MATRKDSPTLAGADTQSTASSGNGSAAYPSPVSSPGMRRMSNGNGSGNGYFAPPTTTATATPSYYPSLPIRNKSRTSSVSSTSTLQPAHNLLHSSQGILLPKRQPTTSQVSSSAVSTVTAAAFSTSAATSTTTTHPYTLGSASSSSSSLSSLLSTNSTTAHSHPHPPNHPTRNGQMNGHHPSTNGTASSNGRPNHPVLVLEPLNNTFTLKNFDLPEHTKIKIGRQTGVSTAPGPTNGYFDSKVLSRVHAEVWSENGKVYIRDLKSSNGTFLNGRRLCPEGVESEPFQLNPNDNLEFGIDIQDENGTMLHEKVACRIFIFRLALSSSGSPPNDARLRSGSTASLASKGQGAPMTTNGAQPGVLPNHGGGQDSNFDLLVSRLQHELVRSQETNGDLQHLRQGLDDLGKIFVVTKNQQSRKNSMQSLNGGHQQQIKAASSASPPSIDYERLMEERAQAHAAEMDKMTRQLETVQGELEQQVARTREMKSVIAESDAMRKELAEAMAEMTKVKLERDQAKDALAELTADQTQSFEELRKEQEAAVLALEAFHATAIERLTNEARRAQEEMLRTHQAEMARTQDAARKELEELRKASSVGAAAALEEEKKEKEREREALTRALEETRKRVEALEQTVRTQQAEVQLLKENREGLTKDLQAEKEKVKELTRRADYLATLTPTTPTSPTARIPGKEEEEEEGASISAAGTVVPNKHSQHQHEFSWSHFVFPMGGGSKRNPPLVNQPSTMLMSGGFMLVGLGAYVLWHRAAGITPP